MRPDIIRAVIGFIKRLIFVEVVVVGMYVIITSLGYYPRLYARLGLATITSFEIAHTVFLFLGQAAIIGAVFVWWRWRVMRLRPERMAIQPEHERLERKSTLRWDMMAGKVNKSLERAAIKTVAAFLNGDGGHLILGVSDGGTPIGMAADYATLARKDADGLTNHFGNIFNAMIGAHVRHLVRVHPFSMHEKECMLISVMPSKRPVYVKDDNTEEFFIRTGNSTTSLRLSEAQAYIDTHWHVSR